MSIPSDVDDILASAPYLRRYSFATNSDDTESDLDGHGRLGGQFLSWGSRYLGRIIANASVEPVAFDPPGLMSSVEWSSVTHSDETASDQDGAGRAVGNALSWAAPPLERMLTQVALRLGMGPVSPMRKIVRAIRDARCLRCGGPFLHSTRFGIKHSSIKHLDSMLGSILAQEKTCELCPWYASQIDDALIQRNTELVKLCRKLVKLLNTRNRTTQYIILLCITALASKYAPVRQSLIDQGVHTVLERLVERLSLRPTGELDILLNTASRALVVTKETRIHAIMKEMPALFPGSQNVLYEKRCNYMLTQIFDPDIGCLAMIGLMDTLDTMWVRQFWSWDCDRWIFLWTWLSRHPGDPLLHSVLTSFLKMIWSLSFDIILLRQAIWSLRVDYPNFAMCLPARARELFYEITDAESILSIDVNLL